MPGKRSLHEPPYHPVEYNDTQARTCCNEADESMGLDDSANVSLTRTSNEEITTVSIDDAIELLGFGPFQYQILCASGLSYAADGMQVILLSFLTPVLKEQWGLSNHQIAGISSTLFVGATFGTLVWGPLADSWGRRPVFLLATFVITMASFGLSIETNSFGGTIVIVFCIGFGVGGLTIPFDILAELLPTHGRGRNLLKINYAWTLGVLYVVAGAILFLEPRQSPSWRQFTTWCSFPCLISLIIGYFFIPESPRWLTSKGRLDEAMQVLRKAAVINNRELDFVFHETMSLRIEQEERNAEVFELLQPPWRGITLRLWGAWFTLSFGYFGTLMVTTRIFSSDVAKSGESDLTKFDFEAIFISSIAEFVGTTMAIVTIDRFGRIPSQVVSFLLAGLFLCMFCVLAERNAHRWILLVFAFTSRIFEMAATCILWVSTAEILNTEIRGAGHSSSNACARIGAIFCPLLVQNNTSLIQVGLTMFLFHSVTGFCVAMLPETNGRKMGFIYTSRI
jgi:MFS family permease